MGGGTDTWPLGALGRVPDHGGVELPSSPVPWLHIRQHLPRSRTVDRLSSPRAMFQTINSGLGFSHAQESSCGLPGSHPQPAEGRGLDPLA